MIKRTIILSFVLLFLNTVHAQFEKQYNILLTGASFATKENGWFELACKFLNAQPLNKAVGGESINTAANRMLNGTLYTKQELEVADAFVIMQVHNNDVFDELELKTSWLDYKHPFDRSNYAVGYDYVIKKYISECYQLKFDSTSKYFNHAAGKPVVIVLCTHWHDARTTYNNSIRKLAEKWGFPLVEFDKNIGFSKNQIHPVTCEQYSLIYSTDSQMIDGQKYGWHPKRGQDVYIQQRMASIFLDKIKIILPFK